MIIIATQCFPPDRGGIENLLGGLADALNARGEAVHVFADRPRTAGEEPGPFKVTRFSGFKPLRRRLKAYAVARAVRGQKVKGIFADSWKSAEFLAPLGVPVAVFAHGMEFPANPTAGKRARIAKALAKAHTIIADSAFSGSLAMPYLADGGARVKVLNPPIGPQPEPPPGEANAIRQLVAGRSPILLTLSRLEPRKGIDMVLRALPDILASHPNTVYVVAGAGGDRARLEKLAIDIGVSASVVFAGSVSAGAKAALFAAADVFVMPSRRDGNSVEGFGIVYLEAAWYGVPAVAGREGGGADAVRDGKTGFLCDATDHRDVGRTIQRILADGALKRQLSAAASTHARGEAQWANAIDGFLGALR
jgi:phosphatidyl-myo-inositol dimannoside synthase